jgi:hypothetical protein
MQRPFGGKGFRSGIFVNCFKDSQVDNHLPGTVVGHKDRTFCDPLLNAVRSSFVSNLRLRIALRQPPLLPPLPVRKTPCSDAKKDCRP